MHVEALTRYLFQSLRALRHRNRSPLVLLYWARKEEPSGQADMNRRHDLWEVLASTVASFGSFQDSYAVEVARIYLLCVNCQTFDWGVSRPERCGGNGASGQVFKGRLISLNEAMFHGMSLMFRRDRNFQFVETRWISHSFWRGDLPALRW